MRLQTQLILSHLFVTVLSVMVFVIGLVIGYWIYLQTPLPAAWTADWAEFYAEEVAIYLDEGCLSCVDELIADQFYDAAEEPSFYEWLIVIDADGTILASNYETLYPAGASIWDQLPFGTERSDFDLEFTDFGNQNERHFAWAPIPEVGGWVYFHGGSIDTAFQLQQTVRLVLLASVALGIISVVVSGATGGLLGYYFGNRLSLLGRVSAAFAAGQLGERVPVQGRDQLSVLGEQFNHMADTISQQIVDLHQLAEANARLAAEAEGLARLEERNHLARELHDAVKQQLFGLNLTLGSIPALLDKKPDIARQRLAQVVGQTQAIQEELDQIIKQIRPVSLQDQGLVTAVRQLAAQWSAQTGVTAEVDAQQEQEAPFRIEQALYRVVQEALQNIGKHADASLVQIKLFYDRDRLTLQVYDDGIGFDPAQVDTHQSFGLQNMGQRTAELDGVFHIDTSPNGTQIEITVPLGDV